jgi:hypothetical protein
MDIVDAGQRPDPRRRWEEATQPEELLALLRDRYEHAPPPSRELRLFAARCARQRGSDPYVGEVLSALEETRLIESPTDVSPELADLRSRYVAVANASTRYLDSPARPAAARRLAAFNALLDDPFDAALGAARIMLRHGASSELDLSSMRAEQLRWLRELFDAPAPEAPPRIDGPFTITGRSCQETLELVRALRGFGRVLVDRDPWIPFPQRGCNLGFGFDALPLPIGALAHLWEHWPAMHGSCASCGEVWGYCFGGTSKLGGVLGCCLVCEREVLREIGSATVVEGLVRPILEETPFHIQEVGPAGVFTGMTGDGRAFWSESTRLADSLVELALERALSGNPPLAD